MGRAHTEPHLVPDKLEMGISSLLPQNIVISETIPGWCSGDEEAVHPSGEGWEGKKGSVEHHPAKNLPHRAQKNQVQSHP